MKKRKTKKDLEAAIEKMHIGGSVQFVECFHNFLDLALSYFCNNMDERQINLRAKVGADLAFRDAYEEAITAFGDLAEDYHDPLGDMFMENMGNVKLGQFFTPESVSLLMSEILIDEKIHDDMTINDPSCGTGRTLLMALKHIRSKGYEPILYANDLSMTCAKMCLLNFLVNSVDGEVTCGDALKLDWENFTFFKIDKVRNLSTGAVLSTYWQYTTADVEKVQEKRQKWFFWIAEQGWIKYRKFPSHQQGAKMIDEYGVVTDAKETYGDTESLPDEKTAKKMIAGQTIDPLTTEIKVGEQLSLFD